MGQEADLMRADLIDAEPDCECGMDHTASVREEIVIQLLYEEHEAHHHPGRYRHPPKGRRNTLLASLGEPKLRKS